MTEKLKHILYTPTDCISEQTMFDYIDHKLLPKEQHAVEKHLLECELCSDAMDGLRLVKNRGIIRTINQEISEKMATPVIVKKSNGINYKIIMSVAAGLLLLMGGVFFFNHLSPSAEEKNTVADLQTKQKEVQPETLPPADSQAVPSATVTTKNATDATPGTFDQLPVTALKEEEVQQQKPSQESTPDELGKVQNEKKAEKTIALEDAAQSVTGSTGRRPDSTSIAGKNTEGSVYEWKGANTKDDKDAAGTGLSAQQKEENKNQPATFAIVTEQSLDETDAENTKAKKAPAEKRANAAGDYKTTPSSTTTTPAYAPLSIAQNTTNAIKADSISAAELQDKKTAAKAQVVDQLPEFPGGNAAMVKFFSTNAKWPPLEANRKITATKIYVQFTIDKNGNVKNPKILKGITPELDKEALRIVNLMPKWKPATSAGKAVEYLYSLPIKPEFK